ncbi:hypothetical protein EXIGLDRAFT_727361 [Exidia glandulosa HHB12029]|uniref:Altered inheritance of mitochondria protein 9, mitochondrial n=1 Tax=Exidia glandulosa HHB12029 TaxID=1314781 RepID=A0A165M1I8_EXIGL|nr:hypothetical protein EXIGLDRAFT_727361 [Exidia glandulosa HHB12029]
MAQSDGEAHLHDDHDDREREAAADGPHPLQVDRRIMREIVEDKTGSSVRTIKFLSSGTFHKAFLLRLEDERELVFRIARRHMPRLKTESEVATLNYIRLHTSIPVPFVHHYDANPLNRMGGEYILMSKAPGIPLSKHYYHLSGDALRKLLRNVAELLIPLFAHRFPKTGSLYMNRPLKYYQTRTPTQSLPDPQKDEFFVGPIVSWSFFGGGRGENHAIDRGPWSSTKAYLTSATEREIATVQAECDGTTAHHRPHLPPEDYEYDSSTDVSDNEDEHWRTARWARGAGGLSDSDSEPGELAYRDYRRTQRSSFLVAHAMQRVETVRKEMKRFLDVMQSLGAFPSDGGKDEFSLDMHDISLENIFVDEEDHSKVTCVIDWESTTVRPLWFCAHIPSFLEHAYPHPQLAPNVSASSIFWEEAVKIAGAGEEWGRAEQEGHALRAAHRMIEWDGWEEGLADAILGEEDDGDEEGEPTQRAPAQFGTVVPATDGGLVVVNSRSPRSGIGPKGGGLNGNGAGGSRHGAGVDLALLNGLEARLRQDGFINDSDHD